MGKDRKLAFFVVVAASAFAAFAFLWGYQKGEDSMRMRFHVVEMGNSGNFTVCEQWAKSHVLIDYKPEIPSMYCDSPKTYKVEQL